MSELITKPAGRDFRWQLLATVSALTLSTIAASQGVKAGENADRPTFWIELGGQLERVEADQEQLNPLFIQNSIRAPLWQITPSDVQHSPRYSFGGEVNLRLEPAGTDWIISAGVRYGRGNRDKEALQQSAVPTLVQGSQLGGGNATGMIPARLQVGNQFATKQHSSYTIADFKAGKDVGLGLLGGKSTVELGIRFAQFSSAANTTLKSRPTLGQIKIKNVLGFNQAYYYPKVYRAAANDTRNFRGIGPSLSWEASAPIVGKADEGQVLFDWGLNAAVLFGRQKAHTNHQTMGSSFKQTYTTKYNKLSSYTTGNSDSRSRMVVVPNVGGFAGLSLSYPNAKVSLGYRADFFWGAMDGGLDQRKSSDRSFYGPFAKISIGLGG